MTDRVDITPLVTEANPVPDPVTVADEFDIRASLLAAIDARSEHMAHTTQDTPTTGSRPHEHQGRRRPALAFAGMTILLIVAIGAAVLLFGGGDEPIADTPPSTLDVESLSWERVPHEEAAFRPNEKGHRMTDVIAWDGGFVAVGGTQPFLGFRSDGAVWLSEDGVTWTVLPNGDRPLGGPQGQTIEAVTTGGPGLVAVGTTIRDPAAIPGVAGAVWTSPDGVNWSSVTYDEAAFGSLFDDDPIATSTWLKGVTAGGPGLVAVGSDGERAAVWTSRDGVNWTRVSHDPATFGHGRSWEYSQMRHVVAGTSGLVAVGDLDGTAAVWTSPDGLTWSAHPFHSDTEVVCGGCEWRIEALTSTPQGFVGIGTEETIENACHEGAPGDCRVMMWTSPDGSTWTRIPHDDVFGGGLDKQMGSDVTTVGDQIVAVGTSVWTSPDGSSWTRVYQDPALGDDEGIMTAVAANDTTIVIVGDDGASEEQRRTRVIDLDDGEQVVEQISESTWTASGIVWVGTTQTTDQSSGD